MLREGLGRLGCLGYSGDTCGMEFGCWLLGLFDSLDVSFGSVLGDHLGLALGVLRDAPRKDC